MTESNAMTTWSPQQIQTIKNVLCPGITDDELFLFAEVCAITQLNPFTKQIYAIKRGNRITFQTGIDGFRVVGHRSGKFAGMIGPLWCGEDGEWKDVWLDKTQSPAASKMGIMVKGCEHPVWGVATLHEFAESSNHIWKTKGSVMLSKCAEAQAWRKACPAELGGIYERGEIPDDAPPPTTTRRPQLDATPDTVTPAIDTATARNSLITAVEGFTGIARNDPAFPVEIGRVMAWVGAPGRVRDMDASTLTDAAKKLAERIESGDLFADVPAAD